MEMKQFWRKSFIFIRFIFKYMRLPEEKISNKIHLAIFLQLHSDTKRKEIENAVMKY